LTALYIQKELEQFTDIANHQRATQLIFELLHTDGVQYLVDRGGLWMLNIMISHFRRPGIKEHKLQIWQFRRDEDEERCCRATCFDAHTHVILGGQYSLNVDMPFDITFYLKEWLSNTCPPIWMIMLPVEYKKAFTPNEGMKAP